MENFNLNFDSVKSSFVTNGVSKAPNSQRQGTKTHCCIESNTLCSHRADKRTKYA